MPTLPPSQGHVYRLLKRWRLDSVAAICVAEALTSSEACCQTSMRTLTWCVGSVTSWLRATRLARAQECSGSAVLILPSTIIYYAKVRNVELDWQAVNTFS